MSFAGYKLCDAGGDPIGVLAMFAKHPFPKKTAFLSNLAEMTSRVIIDDKVDKACTPANGISDFSPRMRAIFLTIDCRPVHLPQPLRGADAGIHAGGGHAVDDPPSNGTIFVYPRSKDA